MPTYALVESKAGMVVNRIVLDDPEQWPCPDGHTLVLERDTALEIGGTYVAGVYTAPEQPALHASPPSPPSFLAREFFAQISVADYAAIKAAIAKSDALGLLWDSLKAQGEAPIFATSERFLAGWSGLKVALGPTRAAKIAATLNIPSD